MEKMDGKTKDFVSANISELKRLFPQCVKEGQIDFEELKELLGTEIISDEKERYSFNWFGKKDAKKMALLQTTGTLRPCKEESVDWDKTQNIFIEGDNLEAMRTMSKSYAGEIKMIYIDPPYNTGHDFVYKDDFSDNIKNYVEKSEQALEANPETNGRFHSAWLSMMYPRLKIAYDLLDESGVIFVSIDDNEVHDLRMLMNEIFGEECFKNCIIFKRGIKSVQAQFETVDSLTVGHEYIFMYAKNSEARFRKLMIELDEMKEGGWNNHWRGSDRPTMRYTLFGITPTTGQWRWSKERSEKAVQNYENMLRDIGKKDIEQSDIDEWYAKTIEKTGDEIDLLRLSNNNKPEHYIPPTQSKLGHDLWTDISPRGSQELDNLFGVRIFDNPKPTKLIQRMMSFLTEPNSNDVILDFFAGSGTTAQAVFAQNVEDGGNRKFILVQIPDSTRTKKADGTYEETDAWKAGYKTIAEITKERIRRVIKKIKDEQMQKNLDDAQPTDLGFKVFKLDTTNIRSWDPDPQNLQLSLENAGTMIKDGRSSEDVLYEMLLKYGSSLTSPIKEEKIGNKTIFDIGEGYLYICLEKDIGREVISHIVKRVKENKSERGTRVLFADKCFKTDQDSINAEVLLKQAGVEDIRRI